MSELRGHPEAPDPARGADQPRPDPAEFKTLESLAELRTDERKSYEPSDHAPPPRRDQPAETQTLHRPGLGALGTRIKQAINDRFGNGSEAEKSDATADDPREVHELQRPSFSKDYYTDLPRAGYDRCLVRDQENPVPLFDGPPSRSDVRQGQVGDCGVIATIGAVAGHRPDAIRNAIKQVGDGQYEVTLHKVTPATRTDPIARPTGDKVTYRLNDELPVNLEEPDAPPAGAVPERCAWPALLEKATAGQDQGWGGMRQAAWDNVWMSGTRQDVDQERQRKNRGPAPADAPDGYDRLNIGSTPHMQADLLAELTGEEAEVRRLPTLYRGDDALLDEFRDLLDDDKPILIGSRGARYDSELAPFANFSYGHAYEIVDVQDGKIQLRNPWGDHKAPPAITATEFWEYFREYYSDGSRGGNYTTLR